MLRSLFAAAGLLLLSGCDHSSDRSDRQALRRQCRIPSYAELAAYEGYPAMVGFGQREGLKLSGRFAIPASRVPEFERFVRSDGWEPLPVPDRIKAVLPFPVESLRIDLSVPEGYFRCRTAGNEALHAEKTLSCGDPAALRDYMEPVWEEGPSGRKPKLDSRGRPALKLRMRAVGDVILSVYDRRSGTIAALVQTPY